MKLNPWDLASLLGHVGCPDVLLEAFSYALLIVWPGYNRKRFVAYAKSCRERARPEDAAELRALIKAWREAERRSDEQQAA